MRQAIFVSATPKNTSMRVGQWSDGRAADRAESIRRSRCSLRIRLMMCCGNHVTRQNIINERVLITTLTKRMANS
jgi:excinuclease UvrABC helicase subunit UvrB